MLRPLARCARGLGNAVVKEVPHPPHGFGCPVAQNAHDQCGPYVRVGGGIFGKGAHSRMLLPLAHRGRGLAEGGELIEDFTAGAGSEDRIDLRGLGLSFDWIIDHATDLEGTTLLDLGDSQLALADVALTSLHQDDFLLA